MLHQPLASECRQVGAEPSGCNVHRLRGGNMFLIGESIETGHLSQCNIARSLLTIKIKNHEQQ